MSTALDITKQAYEAFGRRDIPAFLKLIADDRPVAKSVPLMESLTKLQFLRGNELSFSRRLHAIR